MSFDPQAEVQSRIRAGAPVTLADSIAIALVHATLAVAYSNMEE